MAATFYPKTVIKRLPQNNEELWWTVQGLWGYKIPRTRVCPNHCSPFDAFADAFFARHPVQIWKGSRGFAGKSRSLGVLALTEMALLGAEVSVLGASGGQSLNVHAATQHAWMHFNAPKGLLTQPPTKFDTHFNNGGLLRSLMASQTSVRGPHPQRLRLDEIDEMDLEILEGSQGQPMRKIGPHGRIETNTVMSSTHQHADKTMTEMLKRAKANGWPVYEWCWRETSNLIDGWLTMDEVERKKQEIPKHMWDTEYDLQEPSIEGRAIDTESVERCFDVNYGTFSGDKPIKSQPVRGRNYVTGVDWAKKNDMTVISTFDASVEPWTCVAWQKINKAPWPYMVRRAIDQWQTFGGTFAHDATGVGDVVGDIIAEEVHQSMLGMVKPVIMSAGRDRANLFTEYIAGIEHDNVRFPRIEYAYGEHKYVTVDDLFGAGHPPDSFVSGAIAWRQRKHRVVIGGPVGGNKSGPGWNV